jgi:protein TonB
MAAVLHVLLIFGISFSFESRPNNILPSLDVILVQTHTESKPDEADYLAQVSQDGGGESDRKDRPRDAFSSPLPRPEPGLAPNPITPSAPKSQEANNPEPAMLSNASSPTAVLSKSEPDPVPERALPRGDELMEQRLREAKLVAEINAKTQAYAKRPKRKFITAKTREYEYATYMAGWVARVERTGNLNYPPESRRRSLYGELMMTVAIKRDGSIASIDVITSSGHRVLDDAAEQIVRMAGPFARLPQTREQVDELHITRTWRFLPGNVLRSQE